MKGRDIVSSFILKLIGILTMTVDHVGVIFYPDVHIFRIIGRLAFPIFAFLISEGYRKTSDITDYMGRILVFAFFSQLAFNIAFSSSSLNILFTFALALYAIYIYEKKGNLAYVFIIALAAELLHTDYGAYGVFLVFIFHKFHEDFKEMAKYIALITFFYALNNIIVAYFTVDMFNFDLLLSYGIQVFALPSLVFIYYYNQERGLSAKYLFYIFYPGHMLFLYYLKELIIKIKIDRLV